MIEYSTKGASKIRKVMIQRNCVIMSLLLEEGGGNGTTYRRGREGREMRGEKGRREREGRRKQGRVWRVH